MYWTGTCSSPSACRSRIGDLERVDRRLEVVAGDQAPRAPARRPRRRSSSERSPRQQALGGAPGRSRRPPPPPRRAAAHERQPAAHARAAQGHRPGAAAARPSWPRRRARGGRARRRSRRGRAGRRPPPRGPPPRAARAKSWWFSLDEPAPWRITTPARRLAPRAATACRRGRRAPRLRRGIGRGMTHNAARLWPRPGALATSTPSAAASTSAGASRSGGCDALELAREFGTPAYVVAEDDLRARARAFVARVRAPATSDFDVLFASKAFPCTARLPAVRRGGARRATWPRAASCTWRCAAASTRSGSTCTATPSPRRELRDGARAPGVGQIVIDSFDEIDRLERARVAGRQRRADPRRRPASRPTPTTTISTGQAGLEVRLRARRRAARRSSACRTPRTSSCAACTCTSARSCSSSSRSARPSRCSRGWATSRSTTSAAASASPTPPTSEPPSIEDYVDAKVRPRATSSAAASGCSSSPGARWSPTPA